MKNIVLGSLLLASMSYANTLEEVLKDKDIYFSVKAGYSFLNSKKERDAGTVDLLRTPQKGGENISIELGYAKSENIDYSINYEKVNNKDVNLDNIFLNVKYKFPQDKFIPYVGLNVGYSQLSWNEAPIKSLNNDTESASYLIGGNTGVLIPLEGKASIVLNYSISKLGHKAKLEATSTKMATISHEYLHSFSLGFRQSF